MTGLDEISLVTWEKGNGRMPYASEWEYSRKFNGHKDTNGDKEFNGRQVAGHVREISGQQLADLVLDFNGLKLAELVWEFEWSSGVGNVLTLTMAEGGRPPELDLHLLECPICLERLQKPKSLPCFHCFCQKCLGTYITKELSGKMASEASFPCPVCRRVTPPVNPVESKDKWAEHFPTNPVIQDLIQLKERSSEPLYCKPCQTKGNMTNPAKFWCKDMKANFCETCKTQFHDIIHSDCDILDITGYGGGRPKQEKSAPRCDQHDEKNVWYCEDHQLLGCQICVFENHRSCEEVTTTIKYFQKIKDGSRLEDMQDMLKKNTEVIGIIVKDFDEQLQSLVQNQEIALQSITDLHQKVDKRLKKLQKDVTDKLIASFKEEKINMEASLRQCERLMNSMMNTMKSTVTAVEGNDHIETIVLYRRGQAEVESCKAMITEMGKSYMSVSIKHQVVSGHGNLDDDGMGKIIIEKQPRHFPGNHCDLEPHLLEREMKEIGKFNIKIPSDEYNCRVCGVVFLPCDQIVVSDNYNNKLKLFTEKGQFLDEFTIQGRPTDLCLVDNNTVAVAVDSPGGIHVVKVEASKLSLSSEIRMSNDTGFGKDPVKKEHVIGFIGKILVNRDAEHSSSLSPAKDYT
ncbi:E3 ubiquitin-protein ligase TRIM56-like [Pecten maximus]|uniref:E3 ubiquitin-protein ligase TRIM56-like n=1 Tax=Pecten maximus TaxID=6579 RepID=UPI0014581284|nr:E3 ubiquitin-protein ligase TRIM56-like [Pecten maximus]